MKPLETILNEKRITLWQLEKLTNIRRKEFFKYYTDPESLKISDQYRIEDVLYTLCELDPKPDWYSEREELILWNIRFINSCKEKERKRDQLMVDIIKDIIEGNNSDDFHMGNIPYEWTSKYFISHLKCRPP